MRLPTPGSALRASIRRPSGGCCMKQPRALGIGARCDVIESPFHRPARAETLRHMAGTLSSRASASFPPRFVAGLSAAVLIGTAVLAQAPPRSVTILPDAPEAPAATPMRLELLNSTIKVENSAGV